MKSLIWWVLLIILLIPASCSSTSPAPEEIEVASSEPRQIDIDQFYYGPQAIWGDILVGIERTHPSDGPSEHYISTYNLRTREKEQVLQLSEMVYSGLAIYEDKVVWAFEGDIFLLDLKTDKLQQVTNDEYDQEHPVFNGETIVWLDNRHNDGVRHNPAVFDVYAYDLKTGEQRRLTSSPSVEDHSLSIDGSIIAWTDKRHGDPEVTIHAGNEPDYNNEIYVYDLRTGKERRITTNPGNDHNPAISGDRIVWLRQVGYVEADVFSYDLDTGQESKVSSSGYAHGIPDIFGDLVVWSDAEISKGNTASDVIMNDQPGAADIYLYNLKTGTETRLASGSPNNAGGRWRVLDNPVITGDFIVYTHSRMVGPLVYAVRWNSE